MYKTAFAVTISSNQQPFPEKSVYIPGLVKKHSVMTGKDMPKELNKICSSILQMLFESKRSGSGDIPLYSLEVNLGLSGWDLRASVEDLRDMGFLTEHEAGIAISDSGYNEASTRWG